MRPISYKILKNNIYPSDYDYIFKKISGSIRQRKSLLICPIATYALVKSYYDEKIYSYLSYFYLIPDSHWLAKAFSFLYSINNVEKIRATDLMRRCLRFAENNQYKVLLYGTDRTTLNKLTIEIKIRYPKIKIVNALPSKFRSLSLEEKSNLIKIIEISKPNIIFVGLGSPLQEIFTYELIHKNPKLFLPVTIITVGASFDFISKIKPEAPVLIQKIGFEWLFRFYHEPKRLWKRYFIYGLLYLLLVLKQKIILMTTGKEKKCKNNYSNLIL